MMNLTTPSAAVDPYRPLRRREWGLPPGKPRISLGEAAQARYLADYLDGWSKADPAMIIASSAPGYRFDDPFVGVFSTLALPQYFGLLRSRVGLEVTVDRQHLAFFLRGPMAMPSGRALLQFWREAPRLGLTGTSLILVGSGGVISERVAYDLNMASDQLRRPN